MAEGSYIGLQRESKEVIRETNDTIRKMLDGVPEDRQSEVLEQMIGIRGLQRNRAMGRHK